MPTLNLSDEQRAAVQARWDEVCKAFRALLTDEQRAQFDEFRTEYGMHTGK